MLTPEEAKEIVMLKAYNITMPKMKEYLKNTCGIEVKSKINKDEIVSIFRNKVTTQNALKIIEHFKADGINYTAYDSCNVLGISRSTFNKLVKQEKIDVVETYKNEHYSKAPCRLFNIIQIHEIKPTIKKRKVKSA